MADRLLISGLLLTMSLIVQTAIAAAPAADESGQPAEASFDVWEYRVLGNSVMSAADIERAVYPFLGPNKVLADVERTRTALEQAYRSAGYGTVFVDIPEQDVDGGIVRLQVTEGKLRRVKIEGARYFSGRKIRAALPTARTGTVPSLPTLQGEITAANIQTADRTLVPVLSAGSVPGTMDLTLKVDDELPLHGSLELNDQYTADTSKLRMLASVSYDNLFDRLDNVSLQYQTAPEELAEVSVFAASYTARLTDAGTKLSLFYVDSNSEVASLGVLSVLGTGNVFGSRLILPVHNSAEQTHSVVFGADYKDFLEDIQLDASDSFQTPISYVNLSVGHSSVWRSPQQQWSLGTTLNFGSRGFQNSEREFADKRFRGRPNYFYIRSDASSRTTLPADFSLLVSLSGQLAAEPVISNEQFAMGGASGARGYLEAQELGDIGLKATVQLGTPLWRLASDQLSLEGFSFFDVGRVATIDPLPDEPNNADLGSWGIGFNMKAFDSYFASFSWAYPLLDSGRTLKGDSRVLFSISSNW